MIIETALVCLALNVYHESRGETFDGKLAVAHVTMNRVRDKRFPNSVCGVVTQESRKAGRVRSCQFSWHCDGKADKPRESAAWRESLHIARYVISEVSADITENSLWYHKKGLRLIWASRLAGKRQIGNHVFYNVRRKNTRF